jgi:hypothetical protein
MENLRAMDPEDIQRIEGFAMMLEGLKRIPLRACLSVYVDQFTTVSIVNYDGVDDREKEFHIHMHHECPESDSDRELTVIVKHDNKRLAYNLADALKRRHESWMIQAFFDYTDVEAKEME